MTEEAIFFWLRKHEIPRRTIQEVRKQKHWGALGPKNPMYGKRGILSPNWTGGMTPFRQRVYASSEWQQFVRAIRKRDPVCRLCGAAKPLEIHHIDPISQAPLLIMFLGNALRLCKPCHKQLRGKERQWRDRLLTLLETSSRGDVC